MLLKLLAQSKDSVHALFLPQSLGLRGERHSLPLPGGVCLAHIHGQAESEGQMEGQIWIRSEVVVGADGRGGH